jgi:hypothetical protein
MSHSTPSFSHQKSYTWSTEKEQNHHVPCTTSRSTLVHRYTYVETNISVSTRQIGGEPFTKSYTWATETYSTLTFRHPQAILL